MVDIVIQDAFTFAAPTPSVDPATGPTAGNTDVTIYGSGFTGATGVLFDTDAATSVVVVNDYQITCKTPAHATGLVDVTVQVSPSDVVIPDAFLFSDIGIPSISNLSPTKGSHLGGTPVTITGDNLTGTTAVDFGGEAATDIVVVNNNTVTCKTPAHSTGLVDVFLTTAGPSNTLEDAFEFQPLEQVTQLPLLIVNFSNPNIRVTQLPILMVSLPSQGLRITQAPILDVWHPTPVPFPLPVVPEAPVKETWEYLTVINIAESGKEQRSCLRAYPRIGMSFTAYIVGDTDRRDIYQMLFKYIKEKFNYPLYSHSAVVTAPASTSDTKLYFNPASTDLRDGETLALFDPQLVNTHLVTVETVDSDGATLSDPLPFNVSAGWLVCPAPEFRIPSTASFSMDSVSGEMSLTMQSTEPRSTLRPDQSDSLLTMVDGMLLIDKRPLADDSVDESFDQNVTWLDNSVAPPEPRTNWLAPFISGNRSYIIHRPTDMDYWRAAADYLRGRQNPFLLPTFRDDLPLSEQPALGATVIKSSNIQLFTFWRSNAYRYVRIQSDAGVIYRKILEVTANYNSEGDPVSVNIKLASSIGSGAGANTNMVVSYTNTCRLDSDSIAFEHGFIDSTVTLKVRTIDG